MDFSAALAALKGGGRITRAGWNGHGMWLTLVPGSTITVAPDRPLGAAMPDRIGQQLHYRAHIDMKTVNDEIVPWVSSQTDLLAEDWEVLDA